MTKDKYLNFFLISLFFILSFILSFLKTLYTSDFHHWEIITYSVEKFRYLNPFVNYFEQYGVLTSLLMWPLTYFESTRIILGLLVSIFFLIQAYFIYLISKKFFGSVGGLFILALFFVIYPRIQYPWPDYLAATLISIYIYFSIKDRYLTQINYFIPFLISIACFAREVLIFYFCIIFIFIILINLIYENKLSTQCKMIFLGLVYHFILLFLYLIYLGDYNFFFLQIFNFSFWEQNPSNETSLIVGLLKVFKRFYNLFFYANSSVKIFIPLIFISFFITSFILALRILIKPISFNDQLFIKILLLSIFGFFGIIMSAHIPDLFRIQIYCFYSVISLFAITQITYDIFDFCFLKVLYVKVIFIILFLLSGLNYSYKDPMNESIFPDFRKKIQFYSYLLTNEQYLFYSSLFYSLKDINFLNTTLDPIIDKLIPSANPNQQLPFYSKDFVKKINANVDLNIYEFFLVRSNQKMNCDLISKYPQTTTNFTDFNLYLCPQKN